ncbi:MAG: branched-chain amino acid ABC transporter permease [Candidatus Limnocylindrales bacterium]
MPAVPVAAGGAAGVATFLLRVRSDPARSRQVRVGSILVLLLLAALLPEFQRNQYVVSVGMQVEVMMCLALGLNMVVGYAGLLDLGFAAFFAIGAYTTGLLSTDLGWPILLTLPIALVLALVGAIMVGTPTLRLRSDYLAVVTLGFGEIIQNVVNNLQQTGGPTGIFGIPPLAIGGFDIVSPVGYYYVFFVLLVVFIGVTWRIRNSWLGRAWLAIREDEDVAQAMGIKTQRYKLYAYMAGAILGAITGSFYAPAMVGIAPPTFGFLESLLVVMAVSIGGMGSLAGALLGALVVMAGPELLRAFSQARLLIFGIVLVMMMMSRPQGVWPEGGLGIGRKFDALLRRRARPVAEAAAPTAQRGGGSG